MLETLKEKIDKGMEYAFMTTEKVTKAAKDLAREHNLTKEEAKKLLDQLLKKSEETRKNLETNIQELVKVALEKVNAPVRNDIKKLEERILKLEAYHKIPVRTRTVKKNPVSAKKRKTGK